MPFHSFINSRMAFPASSSGVIDKLFDKLNLSASQKKLSNFKSTISKEGNLYREREKLVRAYENMKNEIQTYENN